MAWVVEGRHGALEVLYDRYANLIYSFALRMLGEREAARELVQEAYLRVWQRAGEYEPHRGSFVKWLLTLVHRLGVDQVRRGRLQDGEMELRAEDAGNGFPTGTEQHAEAEMDAWIALRRRRIREALAALSHEQRRAVELAYFGGYTHEEIAKVTGESLGTVKSRMRLSLRKVREVLHPEDVEVGPA